MQDLVWLHSGMSATQWLTASFWLPAVYGLVAPVNSPATDPTLSPRSGNY